MFRPPLSAACCLLLLLPIGAAAKPPALVLLRNGNVMMGHVHQEAGRVRLRNQRSEFWLASSDVATIVDSLEEAYAWQRARATVPTAIDHMRLASWCLKHELYPQASRELLDARALAPSDPRLPALERQLFEMALAKPSPEQPDRVADPRIIPAAHVKEYAQLPEGALEQFTRHFQPLLVNNCTTSGCHQSGGDRTFQLNRDLLHGMADQRSTRENLAAVLAAIDRESPARSPLLTAAVQPHAGQPAPLLGGRHAQLAADLQQWVYLVATEQAEVAAESESASKTDGGVFAIIKEQKERQRMLDKAPPAVATEGLRDEFDPEIFNRRR